MNRIPGENWRTIAFLERNMFTIDKVDTVE